MSHIVRFFLFPFLLTVAIEGGLIFLWSRKLKLVFYSFLCNLLTNPAMNGVLVVCLVRIGNSVYWPVVLLEEVFVVIIETLVYRYLCKWEWKKAFLLSFILNLITFLVGVGMNFLGMNN